MTPILAPMCDGPTPRNPSHRLVQTDLRNYKTGGVLSLPEYVRSYGDTTTYDLYKEVVADTPKSPHEGVYEYCNKLLYKVAFNDKLFNLIQQWKYQVRSADQVGLLN